MMKKIHECNFTGVYYVELNDEENKVVLLDEHGYYITSKDRLDSGLADPKRTDGRRLNFFK